MRYSRALLGASLLATGAVLLTGCSSGADVTPQKVAASTVLDVRTSAEFNAGHLEGAVNIDVEAPTFASEVSKLDESGSYLIYCHSGRRAGIAADQMTSLGFDDVTNIGGISEAASVTGLAVVS